MIEQETLAEYLRTLASKASTPGGGAATGVSGAQACALVGMVCRLTRGNEKRIARITAKATDAQARFMALADEDMKKFESVMSAYRLSGSARINALQPALKQAAEVPLAMIDAATDMIDCITELAEVGNPNLVTDTGIASLLIEAVIRSAGLNVLINLKSITDPDFVASAQRRLEHALALADALASVNAAVDRALEPPGKESSP